MIKFTKTLLITLVLFTAFLKGSAQIIITDADLMNSGEDYNMSIGDPLQTVDFTTTGAATVWDFSSLIYQSQQKDSFFSVGSLGSLTYTLTFDNFLFPANKANIVQVADNFGLLSQLPISITDIYNFYYKNSSQYRQVGIGATISGVQAPLVYSNKDIIYNFPLNFGDNDSSASDGSLAIPGLGYFGFVRNRVNLVDGWGTITTPFGTFDALRIRSVVNETDSIYVDSLSFGLSIPQPELVEYKWLAAGQSVPVLQINTSNAFGAGEVVSAIRYRDSVRTTAVNELDGGSHISLMPNPVKDETFINYTCKSAVNVNWAIYNVEGKMVSDLYRWQCNAGINSIKFNPATFNLSNGVYTIVFETSGYRSYHKLLVVR